MVWRSTYEFRGVVGWFAQGYLCQPAGAVVLLRDPEGEALAQLTEAAEAGSRIRTRRQPA